MTREKLPKWVSTKLDWILPSPYQVSEHVNPFFFEEDFNGDNTLDIAFLITNNETSEKGIFIIHGGTLDHFTIGAGSPIQDSLKDLSWVEIWKVYRQKSFHELTFTQSGDIGDNEKIVTLKNVAIELIKTEASSGILYWSGREYKWALTTD